MKNQTRCMVLMLAVAVLTLPGIGRTDPAKNGASTATVPRSTSQSSKRLPIVFKDGGGPVCAPGDVCGIR